MHWQVVSFFVVLVLLFAGVVNGEGLEEIQEHISSRYEHAKQMVVDIQERAEQTIHFLSSLQPEGVKEILDIEAYYSDEIMARREVDTNCSQIGYFLNVTTHYDLCSEACKVVIWSYEGYKGNPNRCEVVTNGSVFCEGYIVADSILSMVIERVKCVDQSPIYYTEISHPFRMLCNDSNVSIPAEEVRGPVENCTLIQSKEVVLDAYNKTEVRIYDFTIGIQEENNQSLCTYPDSDYPPSFLCRSGCDFNVTTEQCVCPLDWAGESCQHPRTTLCEIKDLNEGDCPKDPEVPSFGASHCYVWGEDRLISLQFKANCSFVEKRGYNVSVAHRDLFEYIYWGDHLAISKNRSDPTSTPFLALFQFTALPIHFDRLSWEKVIYAQGVEVAQLVGNDTIAIELNASLIPKDYFAGEQSFIEFGIEGKSIESKPYPWISMWRKGMGASVKVRYGLATNTLYWIIFGVIVGVIVLLLTIYWMQRRIEKYKAHRRALKLEKGE